MILSAGYGTRLWPLTEDRTKPAIPILGKPLVGYVAEYLAQYGCTDILVNLHHRPESVRFALGDGTQFGVHLRYIEEPEILGTSGALDNARPLLEEETFVVINGKIITDIDLGAAFDTHRKHRALATLVLLPNLKRERFSIVKTANGVVTGFGGMPANDETETPLMFTGIQIMEPEIFDFIPRGVFSHSTVDVYPRAIAEGRTIAAHVAQGTWYELSTLQRYLDISMKMLAGAGDTVIRGKECVVAKDAELKEAILWDNVTVEPRARLRRVILADDVRIPAGEVIDNAAVVPASLIAGKPIPEKALKGENRGDNFVVSIAR